MIEKNNNYSCSKCGSECVVDNKKGKIICTNCGLIKEDRIIDTSSEYRYFLENTSSNDPRRVGGKVNMHMFSQIDLIQLDDKKNKYNHYGSQSNSDKYLTKAIKLIKKFCEVLDLKYNIAKQSEEIYYSIQEKRELKGKNFELIIISCILLSCKRNLINIHPRLFENISGCSYNKILKISKIILNFIPQITIHSSEYVKLFSSKLKINNEDIKKMEKLCKEIGKWDFFENKSPKPRTIAAAVIYFFLQVYSKEKRTLNEIKEASGIYTDFTVKKYYYLLHEKKDILYEKAINNN